MKTYELMKRAMPTREEKRRIMRLLGFSGEHTAYKWCEDPEGSGRPNPIDYLDVILDHCRLHHPDVALAIVQHFEAGNLRALGRRAAGVSVEQLLTSLQPSGEKEAMEAIRALSTAVRELVLHNTADLDAALREVEECERQMKMTAVMIRAVRDEQRRQQA